MITLHTFGPMFGLPDPRPLVTKAEVLLKMSGVSYAAKIGSLSGAPKSKLPYIEDGGKKIGDSTFIRFHLEKTYHIDFDKHLFTGDKGIAWAIKFAGLMRRGLHLSSASCVRCSMRRFARTRSSTRISWPTANGCAKSFIPE